jgi:hypothetical protein
MKHLVSSRQPTAARIGGTVNDFIFSVDHNSLSNSNYAGFSTIVPEVISC